MSGIGDIAANRLAADELAANFSDIHPPLTAAQAIADASRCYFCHDAPCIEACPTEIDIPSFIRKIASGNLLGSARTILESNILGGSCARVCPTEILCERACVHTAQDHQPIQIGALQRHATDWLFARDINPFSRAPKTGNRVAIVGAGPAGLACAHALAREGHDVAIFEARPKPGGLNEYGIAAYKLPDEFAQREIAFILSIGGITIEHGVALGRDIALDGLRKEFDAVFLAIGQDGVNALGLPGDEMSGVRDAIKFISELRQSEKNSVPVGRRVVVIGGGNTAIDAATQARRLGAEDVSLVYRRGPAVMSATADEQAWARANNVHIHHWSAPIRLASDGGVLTGVEFARTEASPAGGLVMTERRFTLAADMVLKAIGQVFVPQPLGGALALEGGRIAVDGDGRTSLSDVYAGGDCVPGPDLTVNAVRDGKRAAAAINRALAG